MTSTRMKMLLMLLLLASCRGPFKNEYKCIGGKVYIKLDQVWVLAENIHPCKPHRPERD